MHLTSKQQNNIGVYIIGLLHRYILIEPYKQRTWQFLYNIKWVMNILQSVISHTTVYVVTKHV